MFYAAGFAFFRRENEAQKETPSPAAIMTALSSSYFFIQRTRRAPDEIECARIAVAKVCRPQEMETPRFSPQRPIQSNLDTGDPAEIRQNRFEKAAISSNQILFSNFEPVRRELFR
jgi:hypothetical protein